MRATKREYVVYTPLIKSNLMAEIAAIDPDSTKPMVVEIKELTKAKTLAQLGALHGLWLKEISDQTGYSGEEIKTRCKRLFLTDIYLHQPVDQDAQGFWRDLYHYIKEHGSKAALDKHMNSTSLAWASAFQMREFMDRVCADYTSNGIALSVPDRFYRAYRGKR